MRERSHLVIGAAALLGVLVLSFVVVGAFGAASAAERNLASADSAHAASNTTTGSNSTGNESGNGTGGHDCPHMGGMPPPPPPRRPLANASRPTG